MTAEPPIWQSIHVLEYPNDRALGRVLLSDGNGKYFFFGAMTLKEKLVNIAHYSGCGLTWRLP